MANNNSNKTWWNPYESYTYTSATGEKITIKARENGVTCGHVAILKTFDEYSERNDQNNLYHKTTDKRLGGAEYDFVAKSIYDYKSESGETIEPDCNADYARAIARIDKEREEEEAENELLFNLINSVDPCDLPLLENMAGGKTQKKIAEEFGISQVAVSKRINKLKEELRKRFPNN